MYVVFGNPIQHSLSPKLIEIILNIKGQKKDLPRNFTKEQLIQYLKKNKISFGNITYPYKSIFYDYSDKVIFPADKIRHVNAFIYKDNQIISTNTDGEGFFLSLFYFYKNIHKKILSNKFILIAGTGGTAQSIGFSAKIRGIKPIYISRNKYIENLNIDKIFYQNNIKYNSKLFISYQDAIKIVDKFKDIIIISTLPFSLLSIYLKSDNKDKITNDEIDEISEFFKFAIESNLKIFDSNYKDYIEILKKKSNLNIPENIYCGIYQFIGQGLLSIYFFNQKNYFSEDKIKKIKESLIFET